LPESDIRADIEAIFPTSDDLQVKPNIAHLKQAAKKYPNSARLQFRLGSFGPDEQALRRAAELDADNAVPMYYLASNALSRDSMDEGLAVLTDANYRKNLTDYPISLKGDSQADLVVISVNSALDFKTYAVCRRTAVAVRDYALKLHKQGRTDEGLEALDQAKKMARKLMDRDNANLISLLVGTAILKIEQKPEKQIYTDIGSKEGLARIAREQARLDYLSAGGRYYAKHGAERLATAVVQHAASFIPAAFVSASATWFLFLVAICWAVLVLWSRGRPGSAVYAEATNTFHAGRLIKWYALAFLPIIVALSLLGMFLTAERLFPSVYSYTACVFPAALLLWKAEAVYKRAYRQAAESAGEEISKSAADKREFQRRMMGVMGGGIIFLSILGVLIAGGTKAVTGTYPWDVQSVSSQICSQESQYVKDLLAGKIKVPQRLIREVEQRRSAKPGGG